MTAKQASIIIKDKGYVFTSVEKTSQSAFFFYINQWKAKSAIIVVSLTSDKAIIYYSEKIT
jgi:hypothetical protein